MNSPIPIYNLRSRVRVRSVDVAFTEHRPVRPTKKTGRRLATARGSTCKAKAVRQATAHNPCRAHFPLASAIVNAIFLRCVCRDTCP